MPKNVEIKAKIQDLNSFKGLAKSISDGPEEVILQTDTFFKTEKGRLKLRVTPEYSVLIYYDRKDGDGPKLSDYAMYNSVKENSCQLKEVLGRSNGIRGVVEKKRTLLMCGQTRIHIDEVNHLGDFMELEVVLTDDQSLDDGKKVANDLMEKLQIKKEDLLSGAYIDMLEDSSCSKSNRIRECPLRGHQGKLAYLIILIG